MPQKRGSFGECSMLWPAFFASAWAARALSPEPRAGALADASALVQASSHVLLGRTGSRTTRVGDSEEARVTQAVVDSPNGPWVRTTLGPVTGIAEKNFTLFRGIPYVEPPKRFARAQPKQPWAPQTLNATKWGKSCIGSTSGDSFDTIEGENCLTANIWVAPGGRQNMPVIVYLHGGMNQHGSGREDLRHGDLIVQSSKMPVIYINFDFRLGIFGWIYAADNSTGLVNNLGFTDQQMLLNWVHDNIAPFGGDPNKVTLMGQSEGNGNILYHLVAPGSKDRFSRCVMISPVADIFSRTTNKDRTAFMLKQAGCFRRSNVTRCLRGVRARQLWDMDWVSESLSRPVLVVPFVKNVLATLKFTFTEKNFSLGRTSADLGWHPVVDGDIIPGEPRKLIPEGKWHKVPILMTTAQNETMGILPPIRPISPDLLGRYLVLKGEFRNVTERYMEAFKKAGEAPPGDSLGQVHSIITDKMFMCDIRQVARSFLRGGGEVRVGLFTHKPKSGSVGRFTSSACMHSAACHADDMSFVLPQVEGLAKIADSETAEVAFMHRYMEHVLSFIYGLPVPWVPFTRAEEVTAVDVEGPKVLPGYRREQCDVLDASMNSLLPEHMQRYR